MTKSSATRRETDSFGAIEVPAERLWGAQTQRSLENFPIGDERMPRAAHPRARPGQDRRRRWSIASSGCSPRRLARRDRRGGRTRSRRAARRRISAAGLADRLGHPDQHERQRGDRQPRQRKARRTARRQIAGPSQRSRQSRAVLQRRLPDRHAYRGLARDRAGACCPRCATCRTRCAKKPRNSPTSSRSAAPICRTRRRSRSARNSPAMPRRSRSASPGSRRRCRGSTRWRRAAPRSAPASTPIRDFADAFAARIAALTGLPFVSARQQVRGARHA